MIVKKLIDTTVGAVNSEEFDIQSADGKVLITYDLSGGSIGACNIVVCGRIATGQNPVAVGDTESFSTPEWVYLNNLTETGEGSFAHTQTTAWPKMAIYITGNTELKRIRVWAAYNEVK